MSCSKLSRNVDSFLRSGWCLEWDLPENKSSQKSLWSRETISVFVRRETWRVTIKTGYEKKKNDNEEENTKIKLTERRRREVENENLNLKLLTQYKDKKLTYFMSARWSQRVRLITIWKHRERFLNRKSFSISLGIFPKRANGELS